MKLNDLIERLTSWKSSAMGIFISVVSILVIANVVGEENQEGIIANASGFWDGATQMLSTLSGIILIFSKDKDKTE